MVLLNRADKLDCAPVAADHLEAIVNRVRLVDIEPLRRYEQTDPAKVTEIEASLRSTGILINPVVVDPERQLLIDGHHRVHAFQSLGLPQIPAYTVDYLSEDLTVKGWNHATDAAPEALKHTISHLDGSREGPWNVVVADPHCHELASMAFENSLESAHCLNELVHRLREDGHTVTLHAETDALRLGLNHSYIRPVVDKSDVIEMVENGKLFPNEINRHLIEDRPLNLCVPLTSIQTDAEFRQHLDRACHTAPLAIKPGSRQGERLYEERVTLFRTATRRLVT